MESKETSPKPSDLEYEERDHFESISVPEKSYQPQALPIKEKKSNSYKFQGPWEKLFVSPTNLSSSFGQGFGSTPGTFCYENSPIWLREVECHLPGVGQSLFNIMPWMHLFLFTCIYRLPDS